MKRTDITGIVLAGGESSRMQKDKALMDYHGIPLIMHAVNILHPFCNRVVISANKPGYEFTGCEVWPDEPVVHAPMGGIYSCLKRSLHPWNAVLSCDMPLVDPRLFDHLFSSASDCDVIIPLHHAGSLEPLCGLYNQRLLPLMEAKMGIRQYSLQRLIMEAKHTLIEIGPGLLFYKDNMFANMNLPEDFGLLPIP
jgi:molybdopterin-guanine dinucleotide biosynthesis protein A